MLDPRLLRAFVVIVDSGGFTAAAERLHTTQSTISQQLSRLEEAVGHVLVQRGSRPPRPTEAGERLLCYARRILALHEEAELRLADPMGAIPVRIGLPDDIAVATMSEVFAFFAEQHPEIRLDVTAGLSRDLTRRYRAGEFDVVVVKEQAPAADCIASFPEVIGWFESARITKEWGDPLPLVTFPVGGLYREEMFARLESEQRQWYVSFTGNSLDSVLVAVEVGLGLSLIPVIAASAYDVRPCHAFAVDGPMATSLYAWEAAGAIGVLVELMVRALSERSRGVDAKR